MRLDEDFGELLDRDEALHEDLVPYVFDKGNGHMILSHPLLIDPMFHPNGKHGLHNKRYLVRKEAVEKAEEKGEWESAIFLRERPYRFEALWNATMWCDFDHDPEFWPVVAHVWRDSENIWQHYDDWLELWHSDADNRRGAMDEDDLKFLDELPEEFPVWRGAKKLFARTKEGDVQGLSWTTDKEKAKWFAQRYSWQGTGVLLRATVKKEDVLAAFVGRGESEIVIDPLDLTGVRTVATYDVS